MSGSEPQPEPEFQILVGGLLPAHADEVARDLSEFGIPATIRPEPAALDSPNDWIDWPPRSFEVLVSTPYLEAADEYLRATTHRPEGDADRATILADLQGPSDQEGDALPDQPGVARTGRVDHNKKLTSIAIVVALAVIFVVTVISLVNLLMELFD